VRSDISRSRKIAVPPPGMRYGRYSSCGSRSPPTSSRLNSMPTDRARTPSSDANQSRPALKIALAASGETETSDRPIYLEGGVVRIRERRIRDDRVRVAAQRAAVVDDEGQDGVVVRRRQDLDLSVVLEPVVEVRNARGHHPLPPDHV